MQYFILRVDHDAGEDGARYMVLSTDKVQDYKDALLLLRDIPESLRVDKVVCSHDGGFAVIRTLPDGLTDSEISTLDDAGWVLVNSVGYYPSSLEINVEWKKAHIDKHGELCYTCDYKHTDYGIRSAYIPLSAL